MDGSMTYRSVGAVVGTGSSDVVEIFKPEFLVVVVVAVRVRVVVSFLQPVGILQISTPCVVVGV